MTRFTRLAAVVLFAALLPSSGWAQRSWLTPDGSASGFAQGSVAMCLNGSNQAVPCSAAVPLQVTGGGGGGGTSDATAANQTSQITQATATNTVLGAKTDAKSTATDGTSISFMQVMKQISASVQAPALPTGAATETSVAAIAASAAIIPTATATNAITPVVSTAAEGSHVLKAGAGNLYGLSVTTGASAGYVMIFNATSAPADGAVTPIKCYSVPATSSFGASWNNPAAFSTGITVVFSTTGCFTKTISATAFISGEVK